MVEGVALLSLCLSYALWKILRKKLVQTVGLAPVYLAPVALSLFAYSEEVARRGAEISLYTIYHHSLKGSGGLPGSNLLRGYIGNILFNVGESGGICLGVVYFYSLHLVYEEVEVINLLRRELLFCYLLLYCSGCAGKFSSLHKGGYLLVGALLNSRMSATPNKECGHCDNADKSGHCSKFVCCLTNYARSLYERVSVFTLIFSP